LGHIAKVNGEAIPRSFPYVNSKPISAGADVDLVIKSDQVNRGGSVTDVTFEVKGTSYHWVASR
jgi:hypothetical protein